MKQAQTLDQMIALLLARGLEIDDVDAARNLLLNGNYYRLSGFLRQFQRDHKGGDRRFIEGATFAQIQAVHDLDRSFSTILAQGLALIECAVRSRLAYFSAQRFGERAFYLDQEFYYEVMPDRDGYLDRTTKELLRSKSDMVRRYVNAQDGASAVPVWVAVEALSFGCVSKMIEYAADPQAARDTAQSLSHEWVPFASTIHSLAVLRNRCAHHGQVWHRRLDLQTPRKKSDLKHSPAHDKNGAYPAVLAIKRLARAIEPSSDIGANLDAFLAEHTEYAAGIYFPQPR